MTAMVNILSKSGRIHQIRALLDSGSQVNLLTESAVRKLDLPKCPANVAVNGVGGTRSQIRHKVMVRVESNYSDFTANTECYVVPKVTGIIHSGRVNVADWNIPPGFMLADDSFYQPREADMLIGAELFAQILKQGQIKLSNRLPMMFETEFGWVVSGAYEDPPEVETSHLSQQCSMKPTSSSSELRSEANVIHTNAKPTKHQEQDPRKNDMLQSWKSQHPTQGRMNQDWNKIPMGGSMFVNEESATVCPFIQTYHVAACTFSSPIDNGVPTETAASGTQRANISHARESK